MNGQSIFLEVVAFFAFLNFIAYLAFGESAIPFLDPANLILIFAPLIVVSVALVALDFLSGSLGQFIKYLLQFLFVAGILFNVKISTGGRTNIWGFTREGGRSWELGVGLVSNIANLFPVPSPFNAVAGVAPAASNNIWVVGWYGMMFFGMIGLLAGMTMINSGGD